VVLARPLARRFGLAVIGRASKRLPAAGRTTVRVRVAPRLKRRLRRLRRVRVTLRATLTGASGHVRSISRPVTLVGR